MSDESTRFQGPVAGHVLRTDIGEPVIDGDQVTFTGTVDVTFPEMLSSERVEADAAAMKKAQTYGERYGFGAKTFAALTGFDSGKLSGPPNVANGIPKKDYYVPGKTPFDAQIETVKLEAEMAAALGVPKEWIDGLLVPFTMPPPTYGLSSGLVQATEDRMLSMVQSMKHAGLYLTAPTTYYHVDSRGRVWVDGVLRPDLLLPPGADLGPVTMVDPIEIDRPRPIDINIDMTRPAVMSMRPGQRGYRVPVQTISADLHFDAAKSAKASRPYRPTRDFFKHWDDEDSSDD